MIEGGESLNAWMHSAAAIANYYESRYTDENKEFYIQGIPEWNQKNTYTANISAFGAVMKGSQNAEAAYRLLKYRVDQEYFFHLGFSINRHNTDEMLDQLTSTEYQLSNIFGHMPDQEYYDLYAEKAETYLIKPMSSDKRDELEFILDRLNGCTLPSWPVYQIYRNAFEGYARETMTMEEAYQNTRKRFIITWKRLDLDLNEVAKRRSMKTPVDLQFLI